MKKFVILFLGVLVLTGCARKVDKLLTLKGLADEQDAMSEYVEEQDRKFEGMLKEKDAGTLDGYLNKAKIVRTFGDPVYVKNVTENDRELEAWLYRYATRFFDSEKIYLYFDADENLVRSEYVEGKVKTEEEENGEIE